MRSSYIGVQKSPEHIAVAYVSIQIVICTLHTCNKWSVLLIDESRLCADLKAEKSVQNIYLPFGNIISNESRCFFLGPVWEKKEKASQCNDKC